MTKGEAEYNRQKEYVDFKNEVRSDIKRLDLAFTALKEEIKQVREVVNDNVDWLKLVQRYIDGDREASKKSKKSLLDIILGR